MRLVQAVRIKQRVHLQINQAIARHRSIWQRDPKGNLLQAKLRAAFRKVYA